MAHRIEIAATIPDTRAEVQRRRFHERGLTGVSEVSIVDVYTVDAHLSPEELEAITVLLLNPVTQRVTIDRPHVPSQFSWALEIGYLPGVTDNIGNTAREGIEGLLRRPLAAEEGVYSSQLFFLGGTITRNQIDTIVGDLGNPLIQRTHVKGHWAYTDDESMDIVVPRVKLGTVPQADLVDILNADDEELTTIGKRGIANSDGTRRGPLTLDLTYMKAIREYFRDKERNPTDVELESIAQTWSEHCKHTIFADPIDDDVPNGLFRTFIRGATEEILRRDSRKRDSLVSVFTDNSGVIVFDDDWLITDKAETHNSPSKLDPFGGAITGIVGANRDTIGCGLGAKPIVNAFGYCFGLPDDGQVFYKDAARTEPTLSPKRIMEGVIEGVNVGGNCSGIPTTQGFMYFDSRYGGKPLVFVRTIGLMPRETAGRKSHEKKAQPGDYIVMIGGRVGKDGIHGATFSSEALDSGSPATAVQIGDPITQKKLSDAIVKEARDLGLYSSITDNGAGGLSCSVAEMATESGGCHVRLHDVPLKYTGLAPWEIWISESQERMTLAVHPDRWAQFHNLMIRRGVEATVIGEFTNSGKCVVDYNETTVMDLDMDFLHKGMPSRPMQTIYTRPNHEEPSIPVLEDLTGSLHSMLGRKNIASYEFVSRQYDHEVQGGSVIKPLQGRGRVNGDATVVRPLLNSHRGIVISQGINPSYSDIDTYHMAANAIDTAIRNAVAAGADLKTITLMDNFCWCSSDEPERLGQLKAAVQACYDYAVAFGTPYISGKDSMFNDFKGYDEEGIPIKISVPPTLLISSLGIIEDSRKAVSLDAKFPSDLVYVLGETHDKLGGSEYFAMKGEQLRGERFIGNNVPKVNAEKNKKMYQALSDAIKLGLVASAQSVHRGGLAVALAKISMGGNWGMEISLETLPGTVARDDFALYSESQGRIVVTVAPQYQERFAAVMVGNHFSMIGRITNDTSFTVRGRNSEMVIDTTVDSLVESYRSTFKDN